MELPIKLNSSWISTFKDPNSDFEIEYKRDYLPKQIYDFNGIIEHESSVKSVSNSKIHQVNDENNTKFGDSLKSWTLGNTDSSIIHDDNNSSYYYNSSTSKGEHSFKKISDDNLNIPEKSSEIINQDSSNNDSRFEIETKRLEVDFENEIKPEISISFENSLNIDNLQNSALKKNDSENEFFESEESFIKDSSNLLLQSGVKNPLNDLNTESNDFSNNNLSQNEYYMKEDPTFSNKDFQTRNNEIDDQLCDQNQLGNAYFKSNETNENVEKIENCNLEYDSGNLEKANSLNENSNVNKISPNTDDFEYLKENIDTTDGNKKHTYQNKDKHNNEIQPIKTDIKTADFIHHEPKLGIEKTIDSSTINESDQLPKDINTNEIAKSINNEFLNLEKDSENINYEIVETEIFQKISPSTSNQKSMPNCEESFETKLDQLKDDFENYLSDDNYINTDILQNFPQNLIVNDASQEIIVPTNNIKTENYDSVTDENKKDVNENNDEIKNSVVNVILENENMNSSLSNPIEINDVSENHFNLNENNFYLNNLPKQNENSDKFELNNDSSVFRNSDEISLNQSLEPEFSEKGFKEKSNPTDNFCENDLNENKHDNIINWKTSESVIPDNFKEETNELEIEKDSYFEHDFISPEIDFSNEKNQIDDFLNTLNTNDQLFPNHNFSPVLDEFQKDENPIINKNNYEFDENMKYENLVNENINNSFTNPNEFESFKIVPTNFEKTNVNLFSFVQSPDENKYPFSGDAFQNSDSNNYENENLQKINCTNKEPIEMEKKSANNNIEYEFDNSSCNFKLKLDENLSSKVSANNWKENLSTSKKNYEKDSNDNENFDIINQSSLEYKNKFDDNNEKKIKVKPEDIPCKKIHIGFIVDNDDQSRSINNFMKYKNVDYNQMDDINSYASPSFKIPHTSSLKSDFDKDVRSDHFQTSFNLNENNGDNFGESDNQRSLNNKINPHKMSDKLNIGKPVCRYLENNNNGDDKTMKSNSTIFKLPMDLKSDMLLPSHKMRNSDIYSNFKHYPDLSYNYDSTNLTSKGNIKNNYYPSSQNVSQNNQIKYSNDLSYSILPFEKKRDIRQINESVLANEYRKNKNTPIKNMNTIDSFSVNYKTPPKVQGMFDDNQKMIDEKNERNNIIVNGKQFCKKCMKFHLPTISYDSRNYHNISKPYMGNKNLKSFISSNLPKNMITRENNFGKEKFVSNNKTEPTTLSKCYSKKYNDGIDFNSSFNSNYKFISNAGRSLELRVYCRGRLIYEPSF